MNSLLFLRGTLAVELADVGELGPLQVASSAEMGAVVAGMAENALGGSEGNEVVSRLLAKHEEAGGEAWGVDVEVGLHVISCFFCLFY